MTRISRPLLGFILDFACAVQQIPSPTFHEQDKAVYLADRFTMEGLRDVHIDAAGNVLACLPGGSHRPLVVSAHIDTVHPHHVSLAQTRLPDRIHGPSIGDNSMGVASLFGLIHLLREKDVHLPGDLWLIGNVGEEGLGDLRGMRAVVDHFGAAPVAYLIVEGMGLGHIYHRGLGVERYRISVQTPGGHSWVDYGKPSAIHILASIITQIAAIPLPRHPRTSLNAGMIQGGTSVNTIAAHASFDLDMRSEDQLALKDLTSSVQKIVESSRSAGVSTNIEVIGLRPAGMIRIDHPLVRLAEKCLHEEGVAAQLEIASTDANIPLSKGLPAICFGITTGANAHTTAEFIDTEPVAKGMGMLYRLVSQAWKLAA